MTDLTYTSSQRLSLAELLLPWKIGARLRPHLSLLKQFTKREIEKRYKGTFLGLLWSFFTPLFMLAVYAVVFGFIFKGSYGHPGETKMQFVLGLFCAMLLWEFVAAALASSSTLIVQNSNLVTKMIFPLEILPIAMIGAILVHVAIGFVPLVLLMIVSQGMIPLSALSLVLIFVPVVFYSLGLTWIISALGVFLRDIGAAMPAIITILMFMSAIFFPISAIPEAWRWLVMLNPVAILISMARDALVFGQWMNGELFGIHLGISILIATIGYVFFMKVKSAFADVL